jgi:hypothetical protein
MRAAHHTNQSTKQKWVDKFWGCLCFHSSLTKRFHPWRGTRLVHFSRMWLISANKRLLVCCAALFCSARWTALIDDTVVDPTGKVVPDARVTAAMSATGLMRQTITSDTGSHVIPQQPCGIYIACHLKLRAFAHLPCSKWFGLQDARAH